MARESERQERKRHDQEKAAANLQRQGRPTEPVLLRGPKSALTPDEAVELATPAPTPKKKAAPKKTSAKKPAAKPKK